MGQFTDSANSSGKLVERAGEVAKVFAGRASANDENDCFVEENYTELKAAGLVAAGKPSSAGLSFQPGSVSSNPAG